MNNNLQTATLANGCFWCTEAVFQRLRGISSVVSGYSGGTVANPTYSQVSSGTTGHAECLQVQFDPDIISFSVLLDIFFHTHDPTTLNQQGADHGTQYRSAIFYHDEDQREIAANKIAELDSSGEFDGPIVTEITPFTQFYPAEDYHQNFYNNNRSHPYCRIVIDPKVRKLIEHYSQQLKPDED